MPRHALHRHLDPQEGLREGALRALIAWTRPSAETLIWTPSCANVYLEDQKPDAARQAARRRERELTLIDAYWSLVAISLKEREFAETLELLNVLKEKFDVVFEDLGTMPEYAEFVESPQYQQWLKAQSRD